MRKKHHSTQRRRRHATGQNPRGGFQKRVEKVGPEHFAIIPVDCGKSEAQTRVADFYGNVLLEPFSFDISRAGLQTACTLIRETLRKHQIHDCVCAIETTGRYHRPIKKTFQEQPWDIRQVHPYTTSLIRRSADLGTKTDNIDLAAIHRAAVDGLAMRPEVLDLDSLHWRLLTRHRRDLVEKAATLKIQLKETIHAYLPGFTRLWRDKNFWESPVAATIATTFDSALAMREAPSEQFQQAVRDAKSVIQMRTIDRIRAWTYQAAPADDGYRIHHQRACSLWRDLCAKREEIRVFELDLVDFLSKSPCVLLLAFPGVHVVSASDYGAELGPITNYANNKSITGRAGLYPSRYQSCDTDHADGPLVARRNRQLRAALMRLARNLGRCNQYFMGLAAAYEQRQPDRDSKVVIARSFSRLSYYLIAGGRCFTHAAIQNDDKILQKLLVFYQQHGAEATRITTGIQHAIAYLSGRGLQAEHVAFDEEYRTIQKKRRTPGVVRLGAILPHVLLGINQRLQEVKQAESESTDKKPVEPQNELFYEDVTHGS